MCVRYPTAAKSLQSCLTPCDPIDGSPLVFSVPRILQARTLEWVAISFSNAWKWKVKVKLLSRARLLAIPCNSWSAILYSIQNEMIYTSLKLKLFKHTFFCSVLSLIRASQVALVVKNPPANAGDIVCSISRSGSYPGEGNGSPLQYSYLETTMDRGAWRAMVQGVTKNQTRQSY